MTAWLGWLAAIGSTIICLTLWFRNVRYIMREHKSTVESAARQLVSCRKKAAEAGEDLHAQAVLKRSESIYRQALALYHSFLRKPWIWLPAIVMGFRFILPEGYIAQLEKQDGSEAVQ